MTESFTIKTEVFEGPLDLLLELIEARKLLVNDISLASVCDEYIRRVESMGELPLDEAAAFVALAATLLLIKSRSLLPSLTLSEEESHDIKDLEYRLAIYQIIREAARGLGRQFGSGYLIPGKDIEPETLFLPDPKIDAPLLKTTMERLIQEFPGAKAALPQTALRKIISLEEMIEDLGARIQSAIRLSFHEFAGFGKKEKQDIIVTFLALLELVKQGMVRAEQLGNFEDIMLEHEGVGKPRYE